jgi:Family of unknown function (DUF6064)
MSEWWTYRLTSFLLFSPRTYHRLFDLYNQAVWPAQLAGIAIGLAIVALLLSHLKHRDRVIAGLLDAGWLWVAGAFLYQRYTQINWAAPWFAAAFALQALLLVAFGIFGRIRLEPAGSARFWIATSLVAIIVVGYPLLAPFFGRAWTTAEVFGLAPDPTALATLAVLALAREESRWWLRTIPLLACALGALTQWAMKEPEAVVVIVATLLGLALSFRRSPLPAR